MAQTMIETKLIGVAHGTDTYELALVDTLSDTIVASTKVTRTMPRIQYAASGKNYGDQEVAWGQNNTLVQEISDLENSSIKNFAAFRNADVRAVLIDTAYNYLMREEVPKYDRATIQLEDDLLLLQAEGLAAARTTGSASSGRPKSRRSRKVHSWF